MCLLLSRWFSGEDFEKLFVWMLKERRGVCFSIFLCLSSEKGPPRLTVPFILYYPAWLLSPGELCSQIDALLLWGCSWNIKLYWNIHMWVHLAESNWCATPQGPDGNAAGPQHVLADTLSSGPGRDCDFAKGRKSNSSEGFKIKGLIWFQWPGVLWSKLVSNLKGTQTFWDVFSPCR